MLEQRLSRAATLLEERKWESDTVVPKLAREKESAFTNMVDGIKFVLGGFPREVRINRILRSLHFRQIKERVSEVHSAHPDTFDWIFGEHPRANVVHWMSSPGGKGIYWVTGNAGSGKSTLMKFLIDHKNTFAALQKWAGNSPLISASHFFWSAGNPIQKSQDGLLRTLLFQIMLRDTSLIPILYPERWREDLWGHFEPWDRSELLQTFRDLANLTDCSSRICLFIDGLDEYQGDHRELLSLLFEIQQAPHIKICASSRPWIEFRQAFEKTEWKLAVQDLTSADIRKYVKDKLCPDKPTYEWMEGHDLATADVLANEICRRAQGVFLWVFLVTRSLLKGLANGDSFGDLQSRLEELPTDLEAYFSHMLDTIDTVYKRRTARVFKILMHTHSSLPVLLFHFFDLEEEEPDYAVMDTLKPVPESQVMAIVRPKRYQLIAQCKDLLRLTSDPHEPTMLRDRVSFLHRTVADFFRNKAMESILSARVGTSYEPRLTLSRAFLAMIKSIPPWWVPKRIIHLSRIRTLTLATMFYAKELEQLQSTETSNMVVLDSLDITLRDLLASPQDWEQCFPGTHCQSGFELVARYGPCKFSEQTIARLEPGEKCRLLQQALRPAIIIELEEGFTFRTGAVANIDSLESLLQLGISPNTPVTGTNAGVTVWSQFLQNLGSQEDPEIDISCPASSATIKHDTETIVTNSQSRKRRKVQPLSSLHTTARKPKTDSPRHVYLICRLLAQHGAESQVAIPIYPSSHNLKMVNASEFLSAILSKEEVKALTKLLNL